MTMICIARADGGVTIINRKEGKETPVDEIVARWSASADPSWLPIQSVSEIDSVPEDGYFRNAWTFDGQSISVDMEKARAVHMGKIRIARDDELRRLDIETLKGRDVQAQKQALRDIPQTFDLSSAKTPDDLKALWPDNISR